MYGPHAGERHTAGSVHCAVEMDGHDRADQWPVHLDRPDIHPQYPRKATVRWVEGHDAIRRGPLVPYDKGISAALELGDPAPQVLLPRTHFRARPLSL